MATCPHCRQAVEPTSLLVSAEAGAASRLEKIARLTRQEVIVLSVLNVSSPAAMSFHDIARDLYCGHDEPTDIHRSIYVVISRLRKKVFKLGVRIHLVPDVGYRIECI